MRSVQWVYVAFLKHTPLSLPVKQWVLVRSSSDYWVLLYCCVVVVAYSSRLSISFAFFLHGESTVCASIDVRQHPPLHCLRHPHLSVASHLLQNGGVQGTIASFVISWSKLRDRDWSNMCHVMCKNKQCCLVLSVQRHVPGEHGITWLLFLGNLV